MWHETCDMCHVTCDMYSWLLTIFFLQKVPTIVKRVTKSAKNATTKKSLESAHEFRKVSKRRDFIVLVLLSAHAKRVGVSCVWHWKETFYKSFFLKPFNVLLWKFLPSQGLYDGSFPRQCDFLPNITNLDNKDKILVVHSVYQIILLVLIGVRVTQLI